jgi:hypothetical protein
MPFVRSGKSVDAAVAAPPGAPTGLAASVSGASASFTWSAPASGGVVSSYVLVAGVTPGFASAIGSLNEVTLTVAGASAPGVPTLSASATGTTVNVSWTAGSGGAPTGYVLSASVTPGGAPIASVPLGGTSAAFPGVPSGTYYLRLTATNAAGTSPASNQVTATVP